MALLIFRHSLWFKGLQAEVQAALRIDPVNLK